MSKSRVKRLSHQITDIDKAIEHIDGLESECERLTAEHEEWKRKERIVRDLMAQEINRLTAEVNRFSAENQTLREALSANWVVAEDQRGGGLTCRYCTRDVHRDWEKNKNECHHEKDCIMLYKN